MSIFRLLVAWLVLAALPLQGMAAASMLYCDQAAAAVAVAATHGEHADHDHGHHQASAHDGHAAGQADAAGAGHGDHKCPICALCQVVAIPETTPVLPWADSPSAELPQPRVLALTRAPPRPDKPPRA
jgi:hypothetical protein